MADEVHRDLTWSDIERVAQVERAKQEIRERLDPAILAFLEKRAAQRSAQQTASREASAGTQVTGCTCKPTIRCFVLSLLGIRHKGAFQSGLQVNNPGKLRCRCVSGGLTPSSAQLANRVNFPTSIVI